MADDAIEFSINAKDNASSVMGGVGKAFGLLTAAVTAASAAMVTAVKQSANVQDEMLKLSQRANLSVQAFSELAHAGNLANVSSEKIVTTLAFISRSSSEAAAGVAEYSDSFRKLGIATTDVNGKVRTSNEILGDLAEIVKVNGASAEVMAAGMEVAGRGFNQMIPLLRQGREGLQAAAEDARFLGVSLSQQAAANAEKFNDEITRMGQATQGASHAFSNELIPVLSGVVQEITKGIAGNRAFFKSLGEGAATAVVYAIATFEMLGEIVGKIWTKFKEWFSSAQGFDNFVENAKRAFSFMLDVAITAVGQIGTSMILGFRVAWESFVEIGKWAWRSVTDFFTGENTSGTLGELLFDKIPEATAATRAEFGAVISEMKADWVDTARTMGEAITDTFGISTDGIAERAEELRQIFTDLGTAQVDAAAETAAGVQANLLTQLEARKAYLTEKMGLIDQEFLGENEKQLVQDEMALLNLQLAREKRLITHEEYDQLETMAELRKQANLGSIQARAEMNRLQVSKMTLNAQLAYSANALSSITQLMSSENEKQFKIGKAASIAQAVINTYTAAINAYQSASAIPIIGWILGPLAAAAAVAFGMAQVSKIKSQQFGGQAHAGMTSVPTEGTFLLNKGERVISPEQNKDLTGFLESGGGGGGDIYIENLSFHILENAMSFESLMNMSERQIQELIAGKFYPAIAVLDRRGIRPLFVERYNR